MRREAFARRAIVIINVCKIWYISKATDWLHLHEFSRCCKLCIERKFLFPTLNHKYDKMITSYFSIWTICVTITATQLYLALFITPFCGLMWIWDGKKTRKREFPPTEHFIICIIIYAVIIWFVWLHQTQTWN